MAAAISTNMSAKRDQPQPTHAQTGTGCAFRKKRDLQKNVFGFTSDKVAGTSLQSSGKKTPRMRAIARMRVMPGS